MPKLKKPDCVACGDTGLNSRGDPCVPCQKRRYNNPSVKPSKPRRVKQVQVVKEEEYVPERVEFG